MKVIAIFCLLVAVAADFPFKDYHNRVGIPLATRIKEAELNAIQNGGRVIGGQPAPLGAHPYLVGLVIHLQSSTSVCGSSMLSNTRAITAAHCWDNVLSFTLVFGSEYLFAGGTRVDTSDVEAHPGWKTSSIFDVFQYDLAIIRFNHVAYTDVIQPIALPFGEMATKDLVGLWAQLSGYGRIGDNIPIQPTQVQSHVPLQILSEQDCQTFFNRITMTKLICTSGEGIVGACNSDSGGPLAFSVDDDRFLIGVVSFGSPTCEGGSPTAFVRVTEHLSWISGML